MFVVCNYYPAGNVLGPSGAGENRFFVSNVLSERDGGSNGFDEQAATEGVRTDVPVPNASDDSGNAEGVAITLRGGIWKSVVLAAALTWCLA